MDEDTSLEDRDPEDYEAPDEPEGAFEDDTTASGQREGETIDARLARERPDRGGRDRDTERTGRLSEEDGPDEEGELLGELADDDEDDLSAEEAAVHVRENAPGATSGASDGYVEGDEM